MMRRVFRVLLAAIAVTLVVAFAALIVFTGSDFGRERVRQVGLDLVRGALNGEIDVERVEGNLLDRFALVDVRIADEQGRPFLTAERVSARVAIAPLLSRRILITELHFVDPVITMSKLPDGTWNYTHIFPTADTAQKDTTLGFGSWVELQEITLQNGTLIVHQPFPTDEAMSQATRDSAIAAALAGDTRLRVERVGSGLRQRMDFREINARIPRLVVAHPDSEAIALRVGQLSMLARPLDAPDLVVRDLRGDIRIGEDTISLRDGALQLPDTRLAGSITYHASAGDVEIDLRSDTLAFADLRTLYPPLPERGGGRLDIKAAIRTTGTSEVDVTNARLGVGASRVEGRVGATRTGDTVALRGTNLRFTRFSSDLVEQIVPGLDVRVPGAFSGSVELSGPTDAVRVDMSGSFDPAAHAAFPVALRGIVGTGDAIRARNLAITAEGIPVALARDFVPDLPLDGTVSADAIVNGSTASRFTGRAALTHRDGRAISTIIAEGEVVPRDSMRMRVDVRLAPLSLEIAQAFAPETDFTGDITGRGELRGTPRRLDATLALQLPAGAIDGEGNVDLRGDAPEYQATLELRAIDASAMAPSLPMTALNGAITLSGRGFDPATMVAQLRMNLRDVVVDSAQVAEAVIVADARDARLTLDTLRIRAPFATAVANGTFGLAEGVEGTLTYRVDVSTLAGLQRWIETGDTTLVYPRPLARQRAIAQSARADSIRRAALVETVDIDSLVARGMPWLRRQGMVQVEEPEPLARDSIAGTVSVRGTATGSVKRFTAQARAGIAQLIWGGNEIGRGTVEASWENVGTPDARLIAEVGVDSVRAAGFAFDSTHVQATYRNGTGGVVLGIFPGDTAAYNVRAEYALRTGEGEVRLQDVSLRFDSVTWVSTRESSIRWRGAGVAIDSLELRPRNEPGRSRRAGRIFVNGEMPDRDPGRLELRVDSLRIAPWLALLQSTLPLDGLTSLHAEVEGTRSAPRISGELSLEEHVYNEVPFPELHTEFDYGDRRLRFQGDLRRAVEDRLHLVSLTGNVPIDLSFGDSVANRLVEGPLTIDFRGDSIPLGPLAEFVEAFSLVEGEARGNIGVRGTWERPRFVGSMAVDMPRLVVAAAGVTFANTTARLRMDGDRLVIDTLVTFSGGEIQGRGSVLLADVDRPVFDLTLAADEARVLNNEMGQLVASARLALKGPIDTLSTSGTVTVNRGVIYIPEPADRQLINTGDPALFAVVDTSVARELDVAPPSPLFENALVDVQLEVMRGTWARSADANLEIFGQLSIERDRGDQEIGVSGSLHTDYGDYTIYGRRFTITRGSVRFTGPPTNPVLQVLAIHEVRQASRAPFDIQVTIGGTLEQPNISLDSKAQPTLSQSDLIAFLAFGRSSTSLLEFDGSGIEGGGLSGSSLAGNVAALATRQLAGVAMGALVDEVESDLIEVTAADVLNIRPADLPPGLSLSAVGSILRGTQIEVGKYLDRNTFVVVDLRPTLAIPGATLERRFGSSFRVRTSLETRFLPQRPSLTTGLQPQTQAVFGTLLFWTRRW